MTALHISNKRCRNLNDLRPVTKLYHTQTNVHTVQRGAEDALLTLTNNIYEYLEQEKSLIKIVFFSSAFNTVRPHLMVKKVVHLGVNPRLVLLAHR